MFLISQILLFVIISIAVFLSLWIYLQDRKAKTNKIFLLSSFFLLIWILFGYLITVPGQTEASVIIRTKIAYIGVYGWLVGVYFFLKYFPRKINEENTFLDIFVIATGIILSVVTMFTDLLVEGAQLQELYPHPRLGSGAPFIYAVIFLFFILLFRSIYKKYFSLSSSEKKRIQYLLLGLVIFLVFNLVFNVFLSPIYGMVPWAYIANYAALFFLAFTAYAIVKEELFGIKVVLTTLMVVLIAILLGVDLLVFTKEPWIQGAKVVILLIFLSFGYVLVKSVIREIKRKEELERLSDELVEANIELKEANKKLKRLDKAKSEFISIASHQLRTPLTAIKGYLSMIIEDGYGEVSDEAKEKMEEILGSSERLINLVNDLLNLSRIESGKIKMNFKKVDIVEFINETIKELKIVAENKGLYLNLDKRFDEDLKVEIDEARIRQVVLNIIDNAVKYTSEGGITVRLKKQKVKTGKDSLIIEIEDTGEGMTGKDIENIFESFSRGSAGDLMHAEGAGLGLYIARKFVDMHNGSIWIESEGKGEGTCFFIELPLKQD